MTAQRYRKRPVEIEAWQLTDTNTADILGWVASAGHAALYADDGMTIRTLEGDHLARPGDWVIKGVAGEFYPCKPAIFKQTYELV